MKTSSRTHTCRQKSIGTVRLQHSWRVRAETGQPSRRASNTSRWLPAIQFKISCLVVFLLPSVRLYILKLLLPRGPGTKESVSWPWWYHLSQLRLQPALPAPSSAPATDVCDHTMLPHPISFPPLPSMLHLTAATTLKSASPVRWNADTKAMEPPQFQSEDAGLLAGLQCKRKQRMEWNSVRR